MMNGSDRVHGGNVVDSRLERRRAERRAIIRKAWIAGGIIIGYVVFQTVFAYMVGIIPT